ncbi:MAG TPA: hypothetical protein PKM43_02970, partial [Verrucomicrobiota bacterium]|nr:hypothetical protein [Verrucomicrobiota bacterium]
RAGTEPDRCQPTTGGRRGRGAGRFIRRAESRHGREGEPSGGCWTRLASEHDQFGAFRALVRARGPQFLATRTLDAVATAGLDARRIVARFQADLCAIGSPDRHPVTVDRGWVGLSLGAVARSRALLWHDEPHSLDASACRGPIGTHSRKLLVAIECADGIGADPFLGGILRGGAEPGRFLAGPMS